MGVVDIKELKMKVRVPWTEDKEEFLLMIKDGEWLITENNELVDEGYMEGLSINERPVIKDTVFFTGLVPHHTTDWLRFFCVEHHPDVDFDEEFETDKPGVFARYEERFGRDYDEWAMKAKYNALKDELSKLGYELPWSE